ncbi:transglutaminase-like domain-containing protein [Vallitalea okinawensis]|uniref:transglutaminase-like domain-containing protein n=1 Tax=Vallitalea okinawensis TaxID=2078660 RepID=UPI000CFCAD3F|nr:transglutaminase-like domain-containing protein [Vallitalea okinawensis]
MEKILDYYKAHGRMTEIKTNQHMVIDLPHDIKGIVLTVQNILLHQHWAKRYGIELDEENVKEPWVRSVEEKLIHLNKVGYEHITDQKELKDKMISICRDFSVVAAALCREVGIPARARCGFATYFEKDKYIDHWVLEYWCEDKKRWILVDAQLDDFQQNELGISFNSLDVGNGDFIIAPRAWKMCREGKVNPELFGIFKWWGYEYLISNLLLDANALVKMPMQPWDSWKGYKSLPVSEWSEKDYLIMDQLAEYALHVDGDFDALYTFVTEHDTIKVPDNLNEVINCLK